ncbi:glycosyltransferase [Fibrella sp. USSR17]
MSPPLISIITVTFQACETLENTIKSVASQEAYYEYIIIDGGSTDGTLDIINKYQDIISYWITEPDSGIYDAMNKGISKARGKWLYFLGADDLLAQDSLAKISSHLVPSLSVVFGDIVYDTGHKFKSSIGIRTLLENTLHHQSAFYNMNVFKHFSYNSIYKINADYELNLIIYLQRKTYKYVSTIIAVCGSKGVSSTLSSDETNSIRSLHIKSFYVSLLLSYSLNTYYIYRKIKKKLKHFLIP